MVGLEPDELTRKKNGEAARWNDPGTRRPKLASWPASNSHSQRAPSQAQGSIVAACSIATHIAMQTPRASRLAMTHSSSIVVVA